MSPCVTKGTLEQQPPLKEDSSDLSHGACLVDVCAIRLLFYLKWIICPGKLLKQSGDLL